MCDSHQCHDSTIIPRSDDSTIIPRFRNYRRMLNRLQMLKKIEERGLLVFLICDEIVGLTDHLSVTLRILINRFPAH